MAAGGKEKKDAKRKRTYSAGSNMPSMPDSLITNRRKATALEQTSPKSAAALKALEKKQDNSSRLRAMEDYEANRFKILDSGGTGQEAARYAREQAERDKRAGFGYGPPKIADFRDEEAGLKFKKGGKVRGCGVAQRGLTKGRMV